MNHGRRRPRTTTRRLRSVVFHRTETKSPLRSRRAPHERHERRGLVKSQRSRAVTPRASCVDREGAGGRTGVWRLPDAPSQRNGTGRGRRPQIPQPQPPPGAVRCTSTRFFIADILLYPWRSPCRGARPLTTPNGEISAVNYAREPRPPPPPNTWRLDATGPSRIAGAVPVTGDRQRAGAQARESLACAPGERRGTR